MSNYLWLIDAGDGGITGDGKYTTAPARMHTFDDGLVFHEGVNNRAIVNKLIADLEMAEFEYALIHDPVLDTPLVERVAKANKLHVMNKRCIYISLHSDVMPEGSHGKGSGFSIYTQVGGTKSDEIGQVFTDFYNNEFEDFKVRTDYSDGDAYKEENFYVLRKTFCPAILVENLFFDNRKEAEFLLSESGRERIADALFVSMSYIEYYRVLADPRERPFKDHSI